MYLLLKEAGIINNPDDLIQFAQNTAEKFRNGLPSPAPYVKEAIDPKNVKKGAELLERIVKDFDKQLNIREIRGIKKIGKIPNFDEFIKNIEGFKLKIKEIILKSKQGNKGMTHEYNKLNNDFLQYKGKIHGAISNKSEFVYYYELVLLNKMIDSLGKIMK